MTKRYDVCSPRQGKEKTFWHRVGTAFEGEKGININFDSLPLPDKEGRVTVFLFEPKQKDNARPARETTASAPRQSAKQEHDDEIPY